MPRAPNQAEMMKIELFCRVGGPPPVRTALFGLSHALLSIYVIPLLKQEVVFYQVQN